MRMLRIWGVVAAIALLIGALSGLAQGAHQTGSLESCHGTYLVERTFNPGPFEFVDEAMWTFSEDGTFQATSSSEGTSESPFSHKQGAWTTTDDRVANMVNLDFEWVEGTKKHKGTFFLEGVARNDAVVTFDGGCDHFDSSFAFRFYPPGTDPLDPTDGFASGGGTATGEQLLAPNFLTP